MAPKFHDMFDSLGFQDDGVTTAYPDTFRDDLTAAYDEDTSVYSAKIQTLEVELAAAIADVARLKAHNYDLITQGAPAPEGAGEDEDDDPTNPEKDSEEDEGVSGLFTKKND